MTNEKAQERKKRIFEMAVLIRNGELARSNGELDCSEFSIDEVVKVGIQRIAGAMYLYDIGFRFVIPDTVTIIVKDGKVEEVYSNSDVTSVNVIDLDEQDPKELEELEKEADEARKNQNSVW